VPHPPESRHRFSTHGRARHLPPASARWPLLLAGGCSVTTTHQLRCSPSSWQRSPSSFFLHAPSTLSQLSPLPSADFLSPSPCYSPHSYSFS
jgi:hypothetical protein